MTYSLPVHQEATGPFAGIVTVTLHQPDKPVVVLDQELMVAIEAALRAIPASTRGLVLASGSPRVFVAGADLKAIQELSDPQLHRYLELGARVFGMLSRFPFPTAAAINGAALGGGLEIAMHCDALIASPPPPRDGQPGRPYPIGLPEASLSICPGWGGTNLLPARIDPEEAIVLTATGKAMMFDEARAAGMFDVVAPSSEKLLETAKAWVAGAKGRGSMAHDGFPSRWVGRPDRANKTLAGLEAARGRLPATGAALAVADCVEVGVTRGWEAALAAERAHLVRLRHTPEAKSAIEGFFAKSSR